MQAARASIEAEVQMVQSAAAAEALKDKARKAQKILGVLRKRGADMDASLRKILEDYTAIQADMALLCALDATKVNPELVRAVCRRAMRSALQPVRTDLEMPAMPPSERRTFVQLVGPWADSAERTIAATLKSEVAAA
jgi:hypothetical protein